VCPAGASRAPGRRQAGVPGPGGRVLHVRLVRYVHCTRASAPGRSPAAEATRDADERGEDRLAHPPAQLTPEMGEEHHWVPLEGACGSPAGRQGLSWIDAAYPRPVTTPHTRVTAVRAAMMVAAGPQRILELRCKVAEDPRRKR
jgi:hypothetical protein